MLGGESIISWMVIPGMIGALYCAYDKPFVANCIWVFSNFIMGLRSYFMGDFSLVVSFAVFQVVAMWGVYRHLKDSHKNDFKAVSKT